MPKLTNAHDSLPPSIKNLLAYAIGKLKPKKIVLFGSRARGDAREDSDFDIAFSLSESGKQAWAEFTTSLEEKNLTLHELDLVDIDQLDEKYHENIKREGVVLYA